MKQRKTLTDEQQTLYDALTKLQRACVDIKISDPLASHAEIYRRAKRMDKHHNVKHSERYGYNVMSSVAVKAFLKVINVETIDEMLMTRQQVLNDLQDIAETDINDIIDVVHEDDTLMNVDSGEIISGVRVMSMKRMSDIPPAARKAIKKVKQGRYGIEVELYDSVAVRKAINEMQGYNAPVEQKVIVEDVRTLDDFYGNS